MLIILENEKTQRLYKKSLIGKTTKWFYTIEDEDFFDEMEEKYNCTFDFTGGYDFIKYTIYEIEDESLFPIILDEIFNFLKDPELYNNSKKYNI